MALDRSYWAVKRLDGTWLCEKQTVHDWRKGTNRLLDWGLDVAATDDAANIAEVWLLCPPSHTSPLGNTARLPITRPYSAFSFKVGTADTAGFVNAAKQTMQGHIIGRVDNSDGSCTCFIWDAVQDGLLTPASTVYDPVTQHIRLNEDGTPFYPCKNNILDFQTWRSSLAPTLGRLAYERLGVRL